MDGSSFDRITRRLAVTTNRRGGIAALVAGALGIAGISSADARLELPPRCRNAGSPCQTGDVCCSGRCVAKADGSMRCARTTSNRKRKKKKKKDDGGDTPTPPCNDEGGYCDTDDNCCGTLECSNGQCAGACKVAGESCQAFYECCQGTADLYCCQGLCGYGSGFPCTSTAECCGGTCVSGLCVV